MSTIITKTQVKWQGNALVVISALTNYVLTKVIHDANYIHNVQEFREAAIKTLHSISQATADIKRVPSDNLLKYKIRINELTEFIDPYGPVLVGDSISDKHSLRIQLVGSIGTFWERKNITLYVTRGEYGFTIGKRSYKSTMGDNPFKLAYYDLSWEVAHHDSIDKRLPEHDA